LETLPLTVNGKLDRKALPAPQFASISRRAPRTPQEDILASLFAEVLGVTDVGIDDNFFDLGGHSLLATRLVSRIRNTLDVELAIRTLFESPTVAGLSEQLCAGDVARSKLQPMPRPERIPLSFAQQRLWFLHQFTGPDATYNIPLALSLDGVLDIPALRLALNDVLARHESLRTLFANSDDGGSHQVILPPTQASIELQLVPVGEDELDAALSAAAAYGFDLGHELPIRAWLHVLAPERYVLLLLVHHIASDGWSWRPLARDLAAAYGMRLQSQAPAWPPLPVQYADYSLWQRTSLGDEADPDSLLSRQIAYWKMALTDLPERLNLPADRPYPAQASYRGDHVVLEIGAQQHAQLLKLARDNKATLFMVLHTAVATLLQRLGAGNDISIGTSLAGRVDEALNDLVGFFVNLLVLRTDCSGNPTFRDLLERVRATDLAAYSHQDLPFERLVEIVNPTRSQSHHPLFQVAIIFGNNGNAALELPGLAVTSRVLSSGTSKYDLSFTFGEQFDEAGMPAGLAVGIGYASDLFERSTVQALATRLAAVFDAAIGHPDRAIAEIDLLGDGERKLLLDWNATQHPLAENNLVQRFAQQALASPDEIAATAGDQSLTYAELDARANQLAHHLTDLGVGPDVMVGLCVERSLDMLVGVLGILKAGGAYVPLDPRYPAERLAFMLNDTMVAVLVTQSALVERLPSHWAYVVQIDADAEDIARKPRTAPGIAAHGGNLAYVMYTSGSTGLPKGVAVTHRNVLELALDRRWQDDAQQCVLLHSAQAFDASTYEIWVPLLNGYRVVMAPPGETDIHELARIIAKQGVTSLWLSAGLFHVMAEERADCFAGVRQVIAGGDVLAPVAIQSLLDRFPRLCIVNGYGPTETTTFATNYAMRAPCRLGANVPIGSPLDNTQLYVLDASLRLVPPGVAGELYIGGEGLARGYHNRPALSAERFVANPHGAPGGRMYRTSDMVRWRTDGNLEFIGRADNQVKIRGFRVELGEIETCLLNFPSVAQAAVVVREDQPGNKQLVGYVVSTQDQSIDAASLRRALAEHLPEYMLPAALVTLAALPLTAHGKLDRKALPAPEFASASQRMPRTPQEQALADLFAEVLGLSSVGIDDSFFDLGGHSLLATRLISRVRAAMKIEIPIRTLFETPTVAALIDQLGAAATVSAPLLPMARPERIPLSFAQQRLWFLHQFEGPSSTYNIPLAVRLEGRLDRHALQAAFNDLVVRHESLRTVFGEDGQGAWQRILSDQDAQLHLPVIELAEAGLAAALKQAAMHGFDLRNELPVRASLFKLGPATHVLLLLVHHIASDGWSWAPLVRDLEQAYAARLAGRAPDWTPLPVQYADYTLWQRERLGDEADPGSLLAKQVAYWKLTLEGLPEQLALPYDRARPAQASFRGEHVGFELDAPVLTKLTELANAHQATLFMVLHAAVAALLCKLDAGTDIPLGTPIAGRTDEALSELVGFFVNTLVLRTDCSGQPSFRELLERVRNQDLGAYTHQDLPFERLVEMLNPRRSASQHPLFQVAVVLQNNADAQWQFSGLSTTPQTTGYGVAKFDLTFSFIERDAAHGSPQKLLGSVQYATDLFDAATAERMVRQLVRLLQNVADHADTKLAELDLLEHAERQQLLVDWNATDRPQAEGTLAQRFAEQAARTPLAVAATAGEQWLTYRQLDARANQLAHQLQACGVGPENMVALCVERSLDVLIGVLGILKAGGTYVPLEPRYPSERLAFMLADTQARVIVTQSALAERLPPHEAHVLQLDGDAARIAAQPSTPPAVRAQADQLAYVMYTSGSTGTPKGIGVTHRNVLELAMDRRWHGSSQQRVLMHSAQAFDASTYEMWVPLLAGQQVIIAPPGEADIR
ncbi:non-ribosomal peptide synthetase, partial [Dyella flagellata]